MPDQIDMSSTAEPRIRRAVVDICESCLDGAAGQCHAHRCERRLVNFYTGVPTS